MTDYRALAFEWCEIAVDGGVGRQVGDPIYRCVTEGRDPGPRYSSCADLAHWLLFRLGVRSAYINRAEHKGWKPIVNVGRLCCKPVGGGAGGAARVPRPREQFQRGDVLICWSKPDTTDAHVMICDEHDTDAGKLRTWDYGQGPMGTAAWAANKRHVEGCRRERSVSASTTLWRLGDGRSIRSVLPLLDAIEHARENGDLVDPDLPVGEVLDSIGV